MDTPENPELQELYKLMMEGVMLINNGEAIKKSTPVAKNTDKKSTPVVMNTDKK